MHKFLLVSLTMLALGTPFAVAHADDDERLGQLEDEVHALQTRGASGGASAVADQRLDQVEAQVRDLTGQLERAQFQNAQLKNQVERMSSDMELRFDQMKSAPAAAPAATPAAAPAAVDTDDTDSADQTSAAKPAASASANPKTANAAANPQAAYDDAFAKLRAADYAGAATGFQGFLKAAPTNALAGNAQYWLGETYYVRSQYKDAAVAFAEGYQKYPKNTKAPDNLLKLAMSLGQLGSKDDACITLGELKKNYPNAAPTIKARADQEHVKLACKA